MNWLPEWGINHGGEVLAPPAWNPFADPDNGDFTLQERTSFSPVGSGDNQWLWEAIRSEEADPMPDDTRDDRWGTDLDGHPRIYSETVDMGAYEALTYQPNTVNVLHVNQAVDQHAPGYRGDGSSWEHAIPQLADALEWIRLQQSRFTTPWNADNPLNLYVAKGTYHPLYRITGEAPNWVASDRTFQLIPNIRLYGGFAGHEAQLDDRDWNQNKTILSGVISGQQVFHVVTAVGNVGLARLD